MLTKDIKAPSEDKDLIKDYKSCIVALRTLLLKDLIEFVDNYDMKNEDDTI